MWGVDMELVALFINFGLFVFACPGPACRLQSLLATLMAGLMCVHWFMDKLVCYVNELTPFKLLISDLTLKKEEKCNLFSKTSFF